MSRFFVTGKTARSESLGQLTIDRNGAIKIPMDLIKGPDILHGVY